MLQGAQTTAGLCLFPLGLHARSAVRPLPVRASAFIAINLFSMPLIMLRYCVALRKMGVVLFANRQLVLKVAASPTKSILIWLHRSCEQVGLKSRTLLTAPKAATFPSTQALEDLLAKPQGNSYAQPSTEVKIVTSFVLTTVHQHDDQL